MSSRIIKLSWNVAVRARRRLIAFTVIYGILIMWLAVTLRRWNWADEAFVYDATFIIIAGTIVAGIYAFILSHFRQKDIATLKCLGWDNAEIKWFVIGEIFLVIILGFLAILEISFHFIGVLYYFLGPSISAYRIVNFLIFSPLVLLLALGSVLLAQIPGLFIATWKVSRVRPIVALRAAK